WKGKPVTVTFAPAVLQTVRRYFPGYRIVRWEDYDRDVRSTVALPFAATGDFDGNGTLDIALMLTNRRDQWLLVALHQRRLGGFHPYRLNRWKPADIWTP